MTAAAIPGVMSPDYTVAEKVSFNDPEIVGDQVIYPSPDGHGEVRGYRVRPAVVAGKIAALGARQEVINPGTVLRVADRASRIVVIARDMSHDKLADSLQGRWVPPGL